MTEEQIKEAMSRRFIELIANRTGYKCTKPDGDSGVDLCISSVNRLERNGKVRYFDSGQYIDLQLKATTESALTVTEGGFKFDLEAKTYNDLVHRRSMAAVVPLFLVIFVLPDNEKHWLSVTDSELVLRKSAYCYQPGPDAVPTDNDYTKRIDVDTSAKLDINFVQRIFQEVYR